MLNLNKNQIKPKQFRTKGKGGKGKGVDRGKGIEEQRGKEEERIVGGGDNPAQKVYNVYVLTNSFNFTRCCLII